MKTDVLQNYNEDFDCALNIYESDYSYCDLMMFLQSGSIAQKQAAVLKLARIENEYDAKIVMNNLTGCDGKVREAVSFRLRDFIRQNPEYFTEYANIFLDAIVDINGNICRNVILALEPLKLYPEFVKSFCDMLSIKTFDLAKKAINFDIQDGKYKINKEIFKLYWYLETISEFLEYINQETIEKIVLLTKNVHDYTIREKTAKILNKFDYDNLKQVKEELKHDKNYYVRRF